VEEDTIFSISPIFEEKPAEMLDVDWLTRPDWGQVRVDQKQKNLTTTPAGLYAVSGTASYANPESTAWNWNGPSFTPINTASSVTVYVLDTGIYSAHQEFGGRARTTVDIIGDGRAPTGDCNGHGTHCAGSVGGTYRGIAKSVQLQGVRVLNCQGSGSTANIVSGYQWIVSDHNARKNPVSIVSVSLGGGASAALNDATNSAADNGVIPVVAAGNSAADAKDYSPASAASAICVGATTSTDAIASFSNFGATLKVFSPGSSIHSAYIGSTAFYAILSGTSMATPLVSGAIALFGQQSGTLTPKQATEAVNTYAVKNVVTGTNAATTKSLIYDKWAL